MALRNCSQRARLARVICFAAERAENDLFGKPESTRADKKRSLFFETQTLSLAALRRLICCLVFCFAVGALSTPAHAATITVTSTADNTNSDGVITLREAIIEANSNADARAITFDQTVFATKQTIIVGTALPALSANLTITGPTAGVIIDGVSDSISIFTVNSGVEATFVGLTLSNGLFGITNNGTATVTGSTLSGNIYTILNNGTATVTVTGSTFSGNNTGIENNGTATATVTGSTFSGHSFGVANNGTATVTVTNSTFSGNNYGIYNFSKATVTNSTLSRNVYGIYNFSTVELQNSIVAGNTNTNILGAFTNNGGNIIGVDAKLGPLQDNGGPTFTMLPAADSPAVDAGVATGAPAADQRGVLRPQGAGVDSGAVESRGVREAPNFIVTVTEDSDDGNYAANDISLREAINFANSNADASVITFDPTVFATRQTITVSSALPTINTAVTIQGSAAGVTVKAAAQNINVFTVGGSATVEFNSLTVSGGAFGMTINGTGAFIVNRCTFTGTANSGIFQSGPASTLTIRNSTLSNNVQYGLVTLANGTVSLLNSTISGNGVMGISHNNQLSVQNSLVVGNPVNYTTVPGGILTLDPYSIVSDTAADAKLGPLQDNGGPTFTMALLEGSPAINAGNPSFDGTGQFDQRGAGYARVQQGRLDIGAFESALLPPTPGPSSQLGPNFVVNSVADTDDGSCDIAGMGDGCTLREAIKAANSNDDVSTITFDLPGAGPHTISLLAALPQVRKSTNFDNSGTGAEAVTIARSSAEGTPLFRILHLSDGPRSSPVITISNLTLSGGSHTNGGGAFANYGAFVTVTNCTLVNNTAKFGGAIDNTGTLAMINCTVSGNSATGNGATYGGGAIDNYGGGAITLSSCTFTGNTAPNVTGGGRDGIWLEDGTLTLGNTIVAGNGVQDIQIDTGTATSNGHNLIGVSNVASSFNKTGDQNGVSDPKLGALADNGGLTFTHLPASDSPAINAGNTDLATDQRGVLRPQGAADDIGAVEVSPPPAGPNFVVTVTEDIDDWDYAANDISLREAIKFANSNPDASTITFASPLFDSAQTITLASSELIISNEVTISGPIAGKLTISGNDARRVFRISGGTAAINNLTIANGKDDNYGGGIYNIGGTLALTNCTLSGNTAEAGGGIYSVDGPLALTNSTLSGNTAEEDGGAIFSDVNGTLTMMNCTVSGNSADSVGGGIFDNGEGLTLTNSIISGNTAPAAPNLRGSNTSPNNVIDGDAKLGPLKDNGGPTQTIALLPGSPAINAGTSTGAPETDQRGLPRVGQVDIGAYELQNNAPTVSNLERETDEDTEVKLGAAFFSKGFSDPDENALAKIQITSLPENGVLRLDGAAVVLNQEIAAAELKNLTYTPNSNFSGEDTFDWNGSDGTAYAATGASVRIPVKSINDAPVLDNSGSMSLEAIDEGETNNPGTKVVDIILSAGGDRITDSDAGALEGIAIVAADTAYGSWQYSLDNGVKWSALGNVSATNGRFLAADAATRLRFVPASGFSGTLDPAITFRAWDMTSSVNGGRGTTTANGGRTAFSSATETASISVNNLNDAPVLSPIGEKSVAAKSTLSFVASASDGENDTLTYSLEEAPAGASINPTTGAFSWKVPDTDSNQTFYSFIVKVTDNGTPSRSDEEEVLVTVLKGALFTVTPIFQNGGATLIYRVQNGTSNTLSSVSVTGTVLANVVGAEASRGSVQGSIVNPRTGARSVTWSGFSLPPGEVATLTLVLDTQGVARNTPLTGNWTARWTSNKTSDTKSVNAVNMK